ncbi:MAG: hypothetical protein H5T64_00695 [Chloroflexi bacterium]|nr:hypothetical protein [Chloroflexota bacterium]
MIFVTVGSTDFDLLVRRMDELAPALGDEVVIQIGLGQYEPRNCRFFRFAPSLEPYYEEAELVVSHGGLGSIVEALHAGKRLVCVNNPTTYDSHQEHLLTLFAEKGYLLWCRDIDNLLEDIQRAETMTFERYEEPDCRIHEVIREYLAGLE